MELNELGTLLTQSAIALGALFVVGIFFVMLLDMAKEKDWASVIVSSFLFLIVTMAAVGIALSQF